MIEISGLEPMAKYIEFKQIPFDGKTKRIEVRFISGGGLLGKIQYRPGWRCYIFEPCFPTIWSSDCLLDIVAKLNDLNDERKS